jgi:two-component system, OmpR family, response regulator PhoP
MPRVAVVEDMAELRELIVDELSLRSCQVVGLESAEALYRHMSVHKLDIVVLDIGLPGENGLEVASYLKQLSSVGIIMLTGQLGRQVLVDGIRGGADTFLTKPVDYDVLSAAVFSLHRRLSGHALAGESILGSGGTWSLVDGGWTLRSPQLKTVTLNASERAILLELFAKSETPISRDLLINALTDEPAEFDPHRLEVLIHRLRTKVRSSLSASLPLRSIRGMGYVLTP